MFTHKLPHSIFASFLLLGIALTQGCTATPATAEDADDDSESATLLEAESALGAGGLPGAKIHARGSFSCDFGLPGDLPLDQVPPIIERDRMYMAERPGMVTKQLPIGLDLANGQLFSGGRYLFDQARQAEEYAQWVRHDFVLDGTQFLDRPIFLAPDCHSWNVIGARQFAPIESQVVVRTERWSVPDHGVRGLLKAAWAGLVHDAADQGLTAVWLLHNRDEDLVQLVYFADRVAPPDPMAPDFASLFALQDAPALGDALACGGWAKTFDRTEWILTVWFPFASGDQGDPSLWPYSPPFPQPFCGDGVCEASRGENGAACAADCPVDCGDAVCQAGESTENCPGDCRI